MDDETWSRLKRAALEYSKYRPLLEPASWQPLPGVSRSPFPAGVIGAEFIDYGVRVTIQEVATAAEGEQGWCAEQGYVHLTPVPAADTPLNVVWRRLHTPDEATKTFPTIPAADTIIVEWLAEAEELDRGEDATSNLSSYTIGSTKVQWSQQGGGGPSGATRAQRLRQRAMAALDVPYAEWG